MEPMNMEATFDDLNVDDSLSEFDRTVKYSSSVIPLQRLIHVKGFAGLCESLSFQMIKDRILPMLETAISDVEYIVRLHAAEQFPGIAKMLIKKEETAGYEIVVNRLFDWMSRLLNDARVEVTDAANLGFVEMAKLVPMKDRQQYVLMLGLPLAHDENEATRISGVKLHSLLAPVLGLELCQQFIIPEIVSLTEDPSYQVRKFTAVHFGAICEAVNVEDVEERLLPSFCKLAQDDNWVVRKGCAEGIVRVSNCGNKRVHHELTVVMEMLLEDESKWLKTAVFEHLGKFICTLKQNEVSDGLLSQYNLMPFFNEQNFDGTVMDMKYHCAFAFPGVLLTLGKDRWVDLVLAFGSLYQDKEDRARTTLAYSLHEIAKVIGETSTEEDLRPAFEYFLDDKDVVKLGVVTHFASFLQCVCPTSRENYIADIDRICFDAQNLNWRLRRAMCTQLCSICEMASPEALVAHIIPIVQKLLHDNVADVRHACYKIIPILLQQLLHHPDKAVFPQFQSELLALSTSSCYQHRQIFVSLYGSILQSNTTSTTSRDPPYPDFFTAFAALAADPVCNVRFIVGKTIANIQDPILLQLPAILELQQKLQPNDDLASPANATPPPAPSQT